MADGHSFRLSGFLCFILSLILLYRGKTTDQGQSQMFPRLADDFFLVLQDDFVVSMNLNIFTASWTRRHIA